MGFDQAARIHYDELDEAESPLEQRLRSLSWPEPPGGARERGLATLRPMLDELAARPAPGQRLILH